jgi:hypothetical protein
MNLSLEDCVNEAIDSSGSLPGHIQRSEPNVDMWPGRDPLESIASLTQSSRLKFIQSFPFSPSRCWVKQARESCELCASGSRLHIGSAVGNVAIKDEQKPVVSFQPIALLLLNGRVVNLVDAHQEFLLVLDSNS